MKRAAVTANKKSKHLKRRLMVLVCIKHYSCGTLCGKMSNTHWKCQGPPATDYLKSRILPNAEIFSTFFFVTDVITLIQKERYEQILASRPLVLLMEKRHKMGQLKRT